MKKETSHLTLTQTVNNKQFLCSIKEHGQNGKWEKLDKGKIGKGETGKGQNREVAKQEKGEIGRGESERNQMERG